MPEENLDHKVDIVEKFTVTFNKTGISLNTLSGNEKNAQYSINNTLQLSVTESKL